MLVHAVAGVAVSLVAPSTVSAQVAAPLAARADEARGSTCAGFARVAAKTPAGHCVALVVDAGRGLRMPRRMIEVGAGRYWLVDMGSWEPNRGRLLQIEIAFNGVGVGAPRVEVKTLADRLDRPLGLALGPDRKVYVAEAGQIWRTPIGAAVAPEVVVDGLPADGAHPLKEIAFGAAGQLFINVGSFSDACRDAAGRQPAPCPEVAGPRPRAAVYEARLGGAALTLQSMRPWATGLRNSVALAFVAGPDVLLQGENSIDYPDEREPPEELNVLRAGANHGWPYCVGARRPARGYEGRFDCATTTAPALLWPAHAAPLQLAAVPAGMPGEFAGQLLVAWHGHRAAGHRVVGFALDAAGRPSGAPREWLGAAAAADGAHSLGSPVGLLVDSRGRLFVLDDRNHDVLMLSRDAR